MNLTRITMMITFLSLVVACGTDKPEAPAAAKKPTELEMHGDVIRTSFDISNRKTHIRTVFSGSTLILRSDSSRR
jgi:hypothetical protein